MERAFALDVLSCAERGGRPRLMATLRDRAANLRLYRLAAEVLHAIEAGVFPPNPGWQCKDCQYRSRCWAWQ